MPETGNGFSYAGAPIGQLEIKLFFQLFLMDRFAAVDDCLDQGHFPFQPRDVGLQVKPH
ncbi:MAG: hypothetical protein M3429_10625 [Verrucomicrobiota bacterium]|nr:hypothetical protein [Verrucomicrobiota bacterium]